LITPPFYERQNPVKSVLWLPLLVLLLWHPRAGAQTEDRPRLAVVDLTAVFEAHPRTAAATAELGAARAAARKKFRTESAALKDTLQRHQELLRDGRRAEAAAELEKANGLERSIAELGTTNQRDLEEKFRRAKTEIMEDIARVVREFNAQRGYAVVLDKSAASSNGLPQVLDAPGADDLTAEIIARVKK
jgi:Skp family chaperone for outer membrane proteins